MNFKREKVIFYFRSHQPHFPCMIRLLLFALGTLCDIMSSCHEKRCSLSRVGKIYPQAIAGVGVSSPMRNNHSSTHNQTPKLKFKSNKKMVTGAKIPSHLHYSLRASIQIGKNWDLCTQIINSCYLKVAPYARALARAALGKQRRAFFFNKKFCPSWPAAAFFVTGFHAAAEGSL